MNILYLLTQDIESPSGLGRYYPLAKALVQRGHTVTIAALHPNYPSLKQKSYEQDGIKIAYCGQMQVMKQGSQKKYFSTPKLLFHMLKSTFGLAKAALTARTDLIHIGKPHPMNSIAGLIGKYMRSKTLFLDCDDYEAGSNRLTDQWQRDILSFFERKTPRRAACVTTNTFFMRSKLLSWGIPEENIFYLPNGVDRERFSHLNPDLLASLRSELGLTNKKVIAYIGSLSLTSHPVDLLIDAFVLLHRENPDSVLLIVGGGEDNETLENKVSALDLTDAVRFCGRIPPEKAPLYYRLADVSIDPVHDNEAARGRSPLKLFESWAVCVPFITADVGDRNRLLGSPPAGLLSEAGSHISLAEKISQVLNDPVLSMRLCELGRQRIQGYYWDVLAESLESHYNKSLTG